MNTELVRRLAAEQYEWAKAARHDLHRIPEPGFEEFKTQAYICKKLDELGIPYTTERTWVVGLIEGKPGGRVVGLRADMDSLPVTEPEGLEFRSEHEGRMHACGHDIHMAVQLGTAAALVSVRDQLQGSVKLMFQPAEETTGGGKPMVEAGVMENPHVDVCYGLHVQTRLPLGMIETRPGTLNASTDEVIIDVYGKGGHAAYPETSTDAIVCAANMITALQTMVSRNVSPLDSAVLSLGMISGGVAPNVICDHVQMKGTLRTADSKLRAFCQKRIREICAGTAEAFGARAEVTIEEGYSALINSAKEADTVLKTAAALYGEANTIVKDQPSMGGEDFSYFSEAAPGAFYHLGVTKPEDLPAPGLHSPLFHAEEEAILRGIEMQTALCLIETGTIKHP